MAREAAVVRDQLLAGVDLLGLEIHLRELRLRVEERLVRHLEVERDPLERGRVRRGQADLFELRGRLQSREVLGDVEGLVRRQPEVRHLRVGAPGLRVEYPVVKPVAAHLRADAREVRPELPVRSREVAARVRIGEVTPETASLREERRAAGRVSRPRDGGHVFAAGLREEVGDDRVDHRVVLDPPLLVHPLLRFGRGLRPRNVHEVFEIKELRHLRRGAERVGLHHPPGRPVAAHLRPTLSSEGPTRGALLLGPRSGDSPTAESSTSFMPASSFGLAEVRLVRVAAIAAGLRVLHRRSGLVEAIEFPVERVRPALLFFRVSPASGRPTKTTTRSLPPWQGLHPKRFTGSRTRCRS